MILELTDPTCAELLDLLDGSRTETALLRAAVRKGVRAEDASAMLDALTAAGFVLDARTLHAPDLAEPIRRRLDAEAAALALTSRPAGPQAPAEGPGRRPSSEIRNSESRSSDSISGSRSSDSISGSRSSDSRSSGFGSSAFGSSGFRSPGTRRGVADILRRRLAAHVLITGAGHLAVPIAAILASAGIGHIDPDLRGLTQLADASPAGLLPSDADRPRGVAAAEAVRRAAPDVDLAPLRRRDATFAVLVGFAAPAALTALAYGTRRLAHLAVAVRDGVVVVGPLVRPGRSPCLNCLDLHRVDRDPAWSVVAAQLSDGPDAAEPIAATTALAAAAYAAAEVLTHIDGGQPTTLGATVEIAGPDRASRRSWVPHPRCGCRRRVRSRRSAPPLEPP
jgi:bacteriocin biosynthesis cyclodehydratase domain-containing protein